MMAAELLPSTVRCWSTPPSQCTKAARQCRVPIQGVRTLGRRLGLPAAVSQLAAAAAAPDSPPGYLSRARRPRGAAVLHPDEDAVALQQLLLVQPQQLQQEGAAAQQQHAEQSLSHVQCAGMVEVLQEHLHDDLHATQEHQQTAPAMDQDQTALIQQQQQLQQWPVQQQASNAVPLPYSQPQQQQHYQHWQQASAVVVQQQPRQAVRQQQQALDQQRQPPQQQGLQHLQRQQARQQQQQQHRMPPPQQQQQHRAPPQQQQQQLWQQSSRQPQQTRQQEHSPPQQQLWQHNGRQPPQQQPWQQNGHGQVSQQQQQHPQVVESGYIHGRTHVQQQQQQQHEHSSAHRQQARAQPEQQQQLPPDLRRSTSSNGSTTRGTTAAYSVVPTSIAPCVSQASAAAAAVAAAAAAAANSSRSCRRSSSSSMQAAAAAGVEQQQQQQQQLLLPPAEECVPRAFWGLMREELRPWHREVLVHLCYELPAPACHIYRDMKTRRMQQVLAQRALLEKELRAHLSELVFHQQQIKGWLNTLQTRQPRVDKNKTLNPDSVLQVRQQLLNLKAALGRTRYTLHTLQDRAAAYSDSDYLQYTQVFAALLSEMEDLAELQRSTSTTAVLQLQELQDAAARRVLFARTSEAVAALNREAAARAQALLAADRPALDSVKQRLDRLRQRMQDFDWRYPPGEFVAWRFKGVPKGGRSPWARNPGVQRREPRARQRVQQLEQQPGAPPPLLFP